MNVFFFFVVYKYIRFIEIGYYVMFVFRDIEMNWCWEVVNGDSKIGNDFIGNFMFFFMVYIGGEM